MLGFTVIRKVDLQTLRLSEKSLLAQSEQLQRERKEFEMKLQLAQIELEKYKPVKGSNGKFIKKK